MQNFETFLSTLTDDQRNTLADLIAVGTSPNNRPRNRTATNKGRATMAVTTSKSTARERLAAKRAAKAKGTKTATTGRKSTAKATSASKSTSAGKRAAAKQTDAQATKTMLAMRKQGKPWSEIATALNTTPGKAQFLKMLDDVANGRVDAISTQGTDAQVTKRLAAARKAANEHSSWGWIAARSGLSEGKIKSMLEESGDYTPKAENIASLRAGTNGSTSKPRTASKTAAKKTASTKSTKATAKAKARARSKGSRPSK